MVFFLIGCSPRFNQGECITLIDNYTEFTEPRLMDVRKILLVGKVNYLIKKPYYTDYPEIGFLEIERSFATYDDKQENLLSSEIENHYVTIRCPKELR